MVKIPLMRMASRFAVGRMERCPCPINGLRLHRTYPVHLLQNLIPCQTGLLQPSGIWRQTFTRGRHGMLRQATAW